jgi:hypothetical protein
LHSVARCNLLSSIRDTIWLAYAGQVRGTRLLRSVLEIAALAVVTQVLIPRAERRVRRR